MRPIIHQALKDVRLLRWLLAAWLLVLLLYHGVALAGLLIPGKVILSLATGQSDMNSGLGAANTLLTWLAVAALVALCATLVQADSPARSTAFWLTRPVSGRTMVAGKLLFVLVLVVGLPLALDVLDLLVAGAGGPGWAPPGTWLGLGSSLAIQLACVLPLLAIAAVTEGLAQFVLIGIFEVVAFTALGALLELAVRSWLPWLIPRRGAPIVLVPAVLLVAAVVLGHAYLTRQHTRSVVMVAIAPVFLVALFLFWPWWSPAPRPVGRRLDATSISVGVDPAGWRVVQRGNGPVDLVAALTVTGLPRDATVNLSGRGFLTADSSRLTVGISSWSSSSTLPYEFQLAPAGEGSRVQVAPDFTITLDRSGFERVKGHAVTLQIDVTANVFRTLGSTVIPLAAGATYRTGAVRGEVLDVDRWTERAGPVPRVPGQGGDRGGLAVVVRETAWTPYAMDLEFTRWVLRDASGQRVPALVVGAWMPFGLYQWPLPALPIPRHLTVNSWVRRFVAPPGTTWSGDWPRGWQLVVIRRGWSEIRFSKTLSVRDLRLDALPGAQGQR
jgi:hypothetical protein